MVMSPAWEEVQLVLLPDLILVLPVMPMIQWMIDMHPQGRGQLGIK